MIQVSGQVSNLGSVSADIVLQLCERLLRSQVLGGSDGREKESLLDHDW